MPSPWRPTGSLLALAGQGPGRPHIQIQRPSEVARGLLSQPEKCGQEGPLASWTLRPVVSLARDRGPHPAVQPEPPLLTSVSSCHLTGHKPPWTTCFLPDTMLVTKALARGECWCLGDSGPPESWAGGSAQLSSWDGNHVPGDPRGGRRYRAGTAHPCGSGRGAKGDRKVLLGNQRSPCGGLSHGHRS